VVRGNQTLFMRRDEVEAAWSWIDPICGMGGIGGSAETLYAGTWGLRGSGIDRARRPHLA
jgi:glucose-6-phosphate 1-dehydrogenase